MTIGWLPFVPLMRDATLGHVRSAVERIGAAPGLEDRTRHDLVAATHLLGGYYSTRAALAAIIPSEVLMQSPAYYWLITDERARSIREGLEARFGSIPEDLRGPIESAGHEALGKVQRILMSGKDDATVLAGVRAAARHRRRVSDQLLRSLERAGSSHRFPRFVAVGPFASAGGGRTTDSASMPLAFLGVLMRYSPVTPHRLSFR